MPELDDLDAEEKIQGQCLVGVSKKKTQEIRREGNEKPEVEKI